MESYEGKNYKMTIAQHPDELTLSKSSGTEWCEIMMSTHRHNYQTITIRSKEMTEGLYFMLGQILGK